MGKKSQLKASDGPLHGSDITSTTTFNNRLPSRHVPRECPDSSSTNSTTILETWAKRHANSQTEARHIQNFPREMITHTQILYDTSRGKETVSLR